MSASKRLLLMASLATLATAGCKTAATKPDPGNTTGTSEPTRNPKSSGGDSKAGQPTARAQRAFDDAVRTTNDQAAAGKPDYADQERRFKQVIAMDDTFAEAYYNLGVVYERERKHDEAEEAYKTALAKKPSLRQAEENLAVMQENAGKTDRASETYQQIAQRYPQDAGSRARLAALYQQAGQGEQATKLAREALMRDPKNVTAYKVLLRVAMDQKNYSMAQLLAGRAGKLDPSDPEIAYATGVIQSALGDDAGATESFKKTVVIRDDYLPARQQLATLAVKHHDWASAAAQYSKMVQYQPKSATAHVNLGIALRGLGQVDKAWSEYEVAKKLDDNNADVYYAIGVILEKHKSQPEKALEAYKTFLTKAGAVNGDHPVYESIKTCEQLVALAQQAKQQEEEAKRQAEIDKKNKELEDANKKEMDKREKANADAAKKAGEPDPAAPPDKAAPPADKAGATTPAKPGATTPPPAKPVAGATTPPPAAKPATPPAATTPAKPPADADEPPDAVK
jgi:tetratricopeptide (TPR) repeat protein